MRTGECEEEKKKREKVDDYAVNAINNTSQSSFSVLTSVPLPTHHSSVVFPYSCPTTQLTPRFFFYWYFPSLYLAISPLLSSLPTFFSLFPLLSTVSKREARKYTRHLSLSLSLSLCLNAYLITKLPSPTLITWYYISTPPSNTQYYKNKIK